MREILKKTKKVGIAKVVIRTRQYLCAVLVNDNVLVLNLLRFSNEVRAQKEFEIPKGSLSTYKISAKEVAIAKKLVNAMSSKWNPKTYHDDYRDALMKLIEKKEKGIPIKIKTTSVKTGANVIDFMSLLKKSIADKKTKAAKKPYHPGKKAA